MNGQMSMDEGHPVCRCNRPHAHEGHTWVAQCPGLTYDEAMAGLSDPAEDTIGKFNGPDSGAPDTQRLAALKVYPKTGTARLRVLQCIAASADHGRTDEDGCFITRINPSTWRPRRGELVTGGWVEDSGERRKTTSGEDAVVWVLTTRAKEML